MRAARTLLAALPLAVAIVSAASIEASAATAAAAEIRLTGANKVPSCVTPDRLTAFLRGRNDRLDPRFKDIARWYEHWGKAWRVRWDYAFFQMAVETNFLTYRRGDGRMGDVDPKQNNFAGIGTTGGGVPGDRYPDVKTGVLAHIQHLVAYSGERLADPVAPRTKLKQDDIVEASRRLARPVRFADLARRWAVDKRYGESIEWVADSFRKTHCTGRETEQVAAAAPKAVTPPPAPSKVASRAGLGGEPKLVRAPAAAEKPALATASPFKTIRRAGEAAPAPAVVAAVSPAKPPSQPIETAALPPAPGEARPVTVASIAGCSVASASFGGRKTLLIRAETGGRVRFTTLSVLEGFEQSMAESYIKAQAPGGTVVAAFESRDAAVARAREMCPSG